MKNHKGEPMASASAILPRTQDVSQLFGEHHRRVLRAAYRITGSMADAEDVTQAVFLWLASAGSPVANVGSYLYRAGINGALDLLRRRKTASLEPIEMAGTIASTQANSSPESIASSRELGALLRLAIGGLSPRSAEMFTLRYVEELGNQEIAALMSTSQAVVAVTLHHARSSLKKRLSELDRGKR